MNAAFSVNPNCTGHQQRYNFHVTGDVFSLVKAMLGAIEYQANSTAHFHGNVYLACNSDYIADVGRPA
jgi:hypothetical protein